MTASNSDFSDSTIRNAFAMAAASVASGQQPTSSNASVNIIPFYRALLDTMLDGVVFVDTRAQIRLWSQATEVMTGMSSGKVTGLVLKPSLLTLVDSRGNQVPDSECPLQECLRSGKKIAAEYKITGRSGRESKIEMTFFPVMAGENRLLGAMVLLHDTTVQLDLKRQLKDLYEFSMLDPLTQVANRAEFERVLDEFVRANRNSDFECSLIICDIDFFKSINDNYNHHIGDQALVSFAGLLKKFVRAEDVVARYGGEEFVILCANCDSDSAVERAEEIRFTLTKTPQQMLDGKCITASFGVAELRKSDSATDFFVRADTALLKAKELGRNQVVEASTGVDGTPALVSNVEQTKSLSGVEWRNVKGVLLVSEEFSTGTPMPVLVEKLRGYIIESEAEIRRVEPDFATLLIQNEDTAGRKGNFIVDVEFQEREASSDVHLVGLRKKTFIRITIREGKKKWFAINATDLAPQVLGEIRRYLMISDDASMLRIEAAATKSTRDS